MTQLSIPPNEMRRLFSQAVSKLTPSTDIKMSILTVDHDGISPNHKVFDFKLLEDL